MSYVTANGTPCFRAGITRPRTGNWFADVVVNETDASKFQGAVDLVIADAITLRGWAHRAGAFGENVYARVLGGRGGLGTELAPRGYTGVPLRIPLADALQEAGEVLSPASAPEMLNRFLPKWVRLRQSAGAELTALVEAAGAEWRVLPDGTVWIGAEAWKAAEVDYLPVTYQPELGRLEFTADVPSVDPGQTWVAPGEPYDGFRISTVRHTATKDTVRNAVLFEDEAGGDRTKAGLEAIFRTRIDPRIDAAACYWAQVISQNSDGTLEVRFDSPKIPPLSHVPIRLGIPGANVKVAAGSRVVVEFADGDMTQPIATLWGSASVTELSLGGTTIKIGAGATEALVKGNAYRTAEDTLLTALGAFASALTTAADPAHAAAITLNAAITTFQAAAATYLSTVSKTA